MNSKNNINSQNKINYEILKLKIIQKEYKKISEIVFKLQNVIIKNENILFFSKNQSMKSLNEIIKKLNECYNQSIIEIFSFEEDNNYLNYDKIVSNENIYSDVSDDIKSNNKSDSNDNSSIESIQTDSPSIKNINVNSTNNKTHNTNLNNDFNIKISKYDNYNLEIINNIKELLQENPQAKHFGKYGELVELAKYDPFYNIKQQIILLSKIVGFTSTIDIIYLSLNISNYNFEKESEKFNLLLQVFSPIDYEFEENNFVENNNKLKISKIESNYVVLFNNECLIEFPINDKIIKIKGYIKADTLNIFMRTSQISNFFLYDKKIRFEKIIKNESSDNLNKKIINKIKEIDTNFSDVYLKNMTITDILILEDEEFINKLYEDYYKFLELTKIQFVKLIKIFTKDANQNLYTMFNTIKLLLLGSEENCLVASLLFNLLKDKK